MTGVEYESAEPFLKRRRVAIACDHCRRRKMRCDGLQPMCTYCLDHGITCVYQQPSQRVQVSRHYLDSLTKQVEELRTANTVLANISCGDSRQGGRLPRENSTLSGHLNLPLSPVPEVRSSPFSKSPGSMMPPPKESISKDAQSQSSTIVHAGTPPAGGSYFGGSSTVAFLEVVQTMAFHNGIEIPRRLQSNEQHHHTDIQESSWTSPLPQPLNFKSKFLPPRFTADHLVETYFSYVSDMYTILHEPTFHEEYEEVWQSGFQPDDLWFSILNTVFALGSLFSDRLTPDDSESTATTFFAQAKGLFNYENIDYGNLTMVQALLLMGQYLHIRRVTRCWHVFGIAIRVAQGLGLHLSDINNKCGPVERETRRRCWCGCMVMDTMLAMTFGRPMMIPSQYYHDAEIPAPVDDARALGPQQKENTSPKVLLFINRIKLCIILHSILKALYQQTVDNKETRFPAEDMMKLDKQLCSWKDNLPTPMRMKEDPQGITCESSETRPRYMLYTRYLIVRILLTRPSLAVVADMASTSSEKLRTLDQTFALSAAEACIDTSKHLIDYIRTNLQIERAAWNTTHSIFSAALVLFAAHIIPILRPRILESRQWEDSIELMRHLSEKCSSAQICLSMLERFKNCLTQYNGK